jgi:hypothetical protein
MVRLRHPKQLSLIALAALTACAHVAPYERGLIARPDMTPSDVAGRAEGHVLTIHEGATRSGAVGEAGCGCN